jgi:hypothetical protein
MLLLILFYVSIAINKNFAFSTVNFLVTQVKNYEMVINFKMASKLLFIVKRVQTTRLLNLPIDK